MEVVTEEELEAPPAPLVDTEEDTEDDDAPPTPLVDTEEDTEDDDAPPAPDVEAEEDTEDDDAPPAPDVETEDDALTSPEVLDALVLLEADVASPAPELSPAGSSPSTTKTSGSQPDRTKPRSSAAPIVCGIKSTTPWLRTMPGPFMARKTIGGPTIFRSASSCGGRYEVALATRPYPLRTYRPTARWHKSR